MSEDSQNLALLHEKFLEKQKFFSTLRKIIKYAGWALICGFSGLQIQQILTKSPFTIDDTFTQILFRVTIACLYSSWVYGLNFDLNDEELVFINAPNKGKLTSNSIGMIVSVIFMFAVLFFLTDLKYIGFFVIALSIFSCVGKLGEITTGKFAKKNIDENEKEYLQSKDFVNELTLKTIEHYILGKWLWTRFYIGSSILIIVNFLTFTDFAKFFATKLNIPSANLLIVCSILFYLLVMEVWNWYERINRTIRLNLLKEIKDKYLMVEKNNF